ncbi:MAG: flagellar biosynthetic protein FliQ [Candidatus Gastranaerophilales bacterium]|nr:flagellar biosynthetic protein FliQ [Candidatus Gastranaerophilales bacterium]
MEALVEFLGKGFMVMLMISMPCVLMAALVGLIVGILQAVTQVQEQTIAAAPKIILVFLTIVLLGGYFIKVLTNYFYEGSHVAFEIVPRQDDYVLPDNYFKYTKPFAGEMKDGVKKEGSLTKKMMGTPSWDKKATKRQIYVNSKQTPVVEPNFIERQRIQSNSR